MHKLKVRLRKEAFQPTLLGMVTNPVFIIRHGLFSSIRRFSPTIRGKVLDFGCGSKPYQNVFVNADRYVGCDIQNSGHDHSDSSIDHFYDGKCLPFDDGEFDAVVSFETFEHIFNLPDILWEINRVTRPAGYLLVSIPFAWEEHEVPYDFARYTSFGLTHILKSRGYEVLRQEKTTTYILTLFQLLIAYVAQQVSPKRKIVAKLSQLVVIFPLTVLAYLVNAILPKTYGYFCNIVVLARKFDERTFGSDLLD